GLRFVVDNRGRRDVSAAFLGRLLERRQVDERLEDRPGLPPGRNRAVVLRLIVRTPPDERENLTRLRVEGDERRFGASAPPPARQQLVDVREAVAYGVLRQPLQVQIERRVHVHFLIGGRRQARV